MLLSAPGNACRSASCCVQPYTGPQPAGGRAAALTARLKRPTPSQCQAEPAPTCSVVTSMFSLGRYCAKPSAAEPRGTMDTCGGGAGGHATRLAGHPGVWLPQEHAAGACQASVT